MGFLFDVNEKNGELEKEKDFLIKALLKDCNRVIYVKLGEIREQDVVTVLLKSMSLINKFQGVC